MIKKINSYQELQEERVRAKERIRELEDIISNDVASWNIKNIMSDMFTSRKQGLVGESINLTVDNLVRKFLLRRFSWPVRFIASYLVKNYARNMYSKNSSNIFHWVQDKIDSLRNSRPHRKGMEVENNW